MQNEELQNKIDELEAKILDLTSRMENHNHDGVNSQNVNLVDILGKFESVVNFSTYWLNARPQRLYDQIKVSPGDGVIYIWDDKSSGWTQATIF